MPIRFAVADHVARVTIDRPEVLNAIDRASERELQRIWATIEADREVRVVVLTGAGERAFSAGADMKGGSGGSGLDYWANERAGRLRRHRVARDARRAGDRARQRPRARRRASRWRSVATSSSRPRRRASAFPKRASAACRSTAAWCLLQRQVPFRQAMGMLLTGRRIPAAEAFRMGLVNEVVPRSGLDAAVERWVDDILACAPLSLRAIKQVARRTAHLTAQEAQAARLPAVVAALRSKDSEEGVRAFLEKRKPVWRGE